MPVHVRSMLADAAIQGIPWMVSADKHQVGVCQHGLLGSLAADADASGAGSATLEA